jgi:hypothetical protein
MITWLYRFIDFHLAVPVAGCDGVEQRRMATIAKTAPKSA